MHGLASLPETAETHVWLAGVPTDKAKVTAALSAALMVTLQVELVPLPLQAPPQALITQPAAGVAVSVTPVPLA